MKTPLVSILIPCFNAEKWLTETLNSALSQTWENKEIILVDDGSTDNSLKIAEQFESVRVKVISQPNQGASVARNRAYEACQGEFIQYLDADDLLAPDKIQQQVEMLHVAGSNCLVSGQWARFYSTPDDAVFVPEAVWQTMHPVDWLICSWEGGGMMHPAAWLIPRAVAESAGKWNESLSVNDDGEYFCRVILASRDVQFCPSAKSYYRSGLAGTLSGLTSTKGRISEFQAIALSTHHLLNREDSDRTRRACATAFQRFIYANYPDAIALVNDAEEKVRSLGGTSLKPPGGPSFQRLATVIGWKPAKQLQKRYITWKNYAKV